MRVIFQFLTLLLCVTASAQPIIRHALTTNSPSATTNIARSITQSNNFVGSFTGNLVSGTNLPGSGLQSASVNSNRLDAATVAMFGAVASTSNNWVGSFTGNGSGLTNISQSGLPSNIATNNGNNRFSAAQAFTGSNVFNTSAVGVSVIPGIVLSNGTAAALGAQQASPQVSFIGQGWKTSTSSSTNMMMGMYMLPVQGSTIPTSQLRVVTQAGLGSLIDVGPYFDSTGGFTVAAVSTLGPVTLNSTVRFNSRSTVAVITNAVGNTVNDWTPAASTANFLRMTCTNNITITGLALQLADGGFIWLANCSTNYTITFANEDAGSGTSANRFSLSAATYVLKTNAVVGILYDSTGSSTGPGRWRITGTQ